MEAQPILIALHDSSLGYEISPERVRLRDLRLFVRDVDELLRSDPSESAGRELDVAVRKGSLAIETFPLADAVLLRDLEHMMGSEMIDALFPKRREVISRWQKSVRAKANTWYEITAPFLPRPVVISATTDYRADDADQWVRVERYVRGEVEDLGGRSASNAHIRLPDGKSLTVATDREQLRADKLNRLYKPAMVRITAEYNVMTRDYRNARLIEFVEHDTRFDERELERLTNRGALAWADVPDASAWVDNLRGNDS